VRVIVIILGLVFAISVACAQEEPSSSYRNISKPFVHFVSQNFTHRDSAKATLQQAGFIDSGIDPMTDIWYWQHPKLVPFQELDFEWFWSQHKYIDEIDALQLYLDQEFRGISLDLIEGYPYVGGCALVVPASYFSEMIYPLIENNFTIFDANSDSTSSVRIDGNTLPKFFVELSSNDGQRSIKIWLIRNSAIFKLVYKN